MPTPEEIAAASAAQAAAEQAAIQSAERALAAAKSAQAEADAQKAASATKEADWAKRFAELEAKVATAPQPVAPEGLADVQRFMAKAKDDRRITTALAFGFDNKTADGKERYTRAQMLSLIPDVDPESEGGLTKYEEHLQANATLYRAKGQTPQSVVAATAVNLDALAKKSALFSGARLAVNMAGGLKGRNK